MGFSYLDPLTSGEIMAELKPWDERETDLPLLPGSRMMASMIRMGGCASRKTRPVTVASIKVATKVQEPACEPNYPLSRIQGLLQKKKKKTPTPPI